MYQAAIEALNRNEPDIAILLIRKIMHTREQDALEAAGEVEVTEDIAHSTDFIDQAFQGWEAA